MVTIFARITVDEYAVKLHHLEKEAKTMDSKGIITSIPPYYIVFPSQCDIVFTIVFFPF